MLLAGALLTALLVIAGGSLPATATAAGAFLVLWVLWTWLKIWAARALEPREEKK